MAEPRKLIYSRQFLSDLASKLHHIDSSFKKDEFVLSVTDNNWEDLTLKERMRRITEILGIYLPTHYNEAIDILLQLDDTCTGLPYLILPDFVEVFGQATEHWDISMKALEEFTKKSSAEFAVRPFIEKDQERMMKQMLLWASSENEHVRRLASEGCRPRLPWGTVLTTFVEDPAPIVPILEILRNDSSLYVRKSVANNLNDISKKYPVFVLLLAKEWYGESKDTDWIIKHGCRTLLKQGNHAALDLFGYGHDPNIFVSELQLQEDTIHIGDDLHFTFHVTSPEDRNVRIEFAIDYMKANGNPNKKMFKISETTIQANQKKVYKKKLSFKDLSTRKHYPGEHRLTIIINGEKKSSMKFTLLAK